jgi:hypothetical protein
MTSISINNTQQLLAAMSALEQQMAAIRAQLGSVTIRNKQVHAELTQMVADSEHKPKRELSAGVIAWNKQVHETLAQMKTDGWKHPQTGKEPIYRDALAEAARLRGLADPAVAAKQAQDKAKKAEQKAKKASSSASVASAPSESEPAAEKKVKKNPWADMTEEQKVERIAKMKAGREAKKLAASVAPAAASVIASVATPVSTNPFEDAPASDAESAASSVKKRGPPKGVKLSEEERIKRATKAKATREAKKAAVPLATATNAAAVPLPMSAASSVIVSDDEIDEETFTKQQLPNSSRIVYKNALNQVRAYTPQGVGAWLGMFDPVKKTIDASIPEPDAE